MLKLNRAAGAMVDVTIKRNTPNLSNISAFEDLISLEIRMGIFRNMALPRQLSVISQP